MADEEYCRYCGMKLEERDHLCPECGSSILSSPYYVGDRWFKLPLAS